MAGGEIQRYKDLYKLKRCKDTEIIDFRLFKYFKAAICLILASNTPPTPPHAGGRGGGMGWGGVGYLRQGLSKLLP